jgi:hypothetical protein
MSNTDELLGTFSPCILMKTKLKKILFNYSIIAAHPAFVRNM